MVKRERDKICVKLIPFFLFSKTKMLDRPSAPITCGGDYLPGGWVLPSLM